MKCNICNHKMIKVSDLTLEQIKIFLNDNPLKPLNELKKDDGVLVYYREKFPLYENKIYGQKIQFRKVEKVENNELKLSGFKTMFSFENPTVIYKENLLYTLVPMKKEYLDILEMGLEKLSEKYSGTKLNNIFKKSFMLKEFSIKYD